VVFLALVAFTMTGLAVTVRATIELLVLGSVIAAFASCALVMVGTAGVSGADAGWLPLWMLTTAARVRTTCWAGMGLTMALLRYIVVATLLRKLGEKLR
jgi:hypothetical protein